jgi:hypothetical protein
MSLQNAFLGSLVADAVAMPVHWYYNRQSLDQDYGDFSGYCRPKNSHPDSILWRSKYTPKSPKATYLVAKRNIGDKKEYIIISFWKKATIRLTFSWLLNSTDPQS